MKKTEGFYQGLQWVLDNLKLSEENEQTLKSILTQNDIEEWKDIDRLITKLIQKQYSNSSSKQTK